MQDYKNLLIWQKSHQITLDVYRATQHFPSEEKFGLVSQMRRASVSIPSNIAEGCGRGSDADFRRFLLIAMGSTNEVEYQLILAHELGFLDEMTYTQIQSELESLKRMLNAFIRKLGNKS